jgi:Zn-dependent protease with chaperone function
MTASLRAARALVLVTGFYLMGVVLLAALGAFDWLLLTKLFVAATAYLVAGLLITSVVVAVPIVRGMVAFLTAGRRGGRPNGHPVTARDQPELWAEVRAAADAAGTAAPAELVLNGEVNAGVSERARLLGLRPGRRTLHLGVPLLAGLTVPGLRSVLAHEFGHYTHQDTRLAHITMRSRAAVVQTVDAFAGSGALAQPMFRWAPLLVARLYVGYARFYLRVSQSVARRQEFAADRVAARLAGRDTTVAALRRVPVLKAAHDHYLTTYAFMGVPVGALPPSGELHGGFRRLLAARSPEALRRLVADRRAPRATPYDSHPPMPERVARVAELPDDGRPDDLSAPLALSLLRDADTVLAAVESATLTAQASGLPHVDWDRLVVLRTVSDFHGYAEPLRKAVQRAVRATAPAAPAAATPAPDFAASAAAAELPDLDGVLDAIDRGLLWMAIADRMPKPDKAARLTGASARNFIRGDIWNGVAGLVQLRLLEQGLARPDIAWGGVPGFALPEEWEAGMDAAIDAALADAPDTAPLRALLAGRAQPPTGPV